ncbi:MAG: hypothetical protein HZA15_16315 [Nitrospirae bacterium]|nr:hypothetical protein [Nitrospirota bacterium]
MRNFIRRANRLPVFAYPAYQRLFPVLKSLAFALVSLFCFQDHASAKEACLTCHESLANEKVVHAALKMGCQTCHTAIDAREVPHKKSGKAPRGLSADQPGLCYGCHDKTRFMKPHVHAAVGMGCTGCHNPHSSKNPKLLLSEVPDLCYTCHDKKKFSGKSVHAPVGIGMCGSCHDPHASKNAKLLTAEQPDLCFTCHEQKGFGGKNIHAPVAGGMCLGCHRPHAAEFPVLLHKEPMDVCLECHADVRKKPHAVSGFSPLGGHPLGEPKRMKQSRERKYLDDPSRPGRRFYCGSCHFPHGSDNPRLLRGTDFGLCQICHKK